MNAIMAVTNNNIDIIITVGSLISLGTMHNVIIIDVHPWQCLSVKAL